MSEPSYTYSMLLQRTLWIGMRRHSTGSVVEVAAATAAKYLRDGAAVLLNPAQDLARIERELNITTDAGALPHLQRR